MGTARESSETERGDAEACAAITRHHARTFSLASYFLPPEKRRGTYAIYAFCRVADDLVDAAPPGSDPSTTLAAHRVALNSALQGEAASPVFRELAWAIERFQLAPAPLHELIDGVALDLKQARWDSWDDLREYCEGVAGCVGEICVSVLGLAPNANRPVAVAKARSLGVAMQLTNILRDIGEDARRGRVYLPSQELERHGFTVHDVLTGSALSAGARWHAVMQEQMARARCYYAAAFEGIPLLARDARRCASACALGYSGILDAIVDAGYDTYTQRAAVPWHRRAALLARILSPGGATPSPTRLFHERHNVSP